jgi:hypothetical protein
MNEKALNSDKEEGEGEVSDSKGLAFSLCLVSFLLPLLPLLLLLLLRRLLLFIELLLLLA